MLITINYAQLDDDNQVDRLQNHNQLRPLRFVRTPLLLLLLLFIGMSPTAAQGVSDARTTMKPTK